VVFFFSVGGGGVFVFFGGGGWGGGGGGWLVGIGRERNSKCKGGICIYIERGIERERGSVLRRERNREW